MSDPFVAELVPNNCFTRCLTQCFTQGDEGMIKTQGLSDGNF